MGYLLFYVINKRDWQIIYLYNYIDYLCKFQRNISTYIFYSLFYVVKYLKKYSLSAFVWVISF